MSMESFMIYLLLLVTKNLFSSTFSINSEAKASELIENVEDMFLQYYIHHVVFDKFKSLTTQKCIALSGKNDSPHSVNLLTKTY